MVGASVEPVMPRRTQLMAVALSTVGTLLLCRALFDWLDYGRFAYSLIFR